MMDGNTAEETCLIGGPMVSKDNLRRVVIAFVDSFQNRLLRAGKLDEQNLVSVRAFGLGPEDVDQLTVGDSELGLDSLDRLDLVGEITRFFELDKTGIDDYLLVRRRIGDWVDLASVHLEKTGEGSAISFSTSGSTGTPKIIRHERRALEGEIRAWLSGPLSESAQPKRVVSLVPPHHIYGFLWTVLLPQIQNVDVVDLSHSPPSSVLSAAKDGDLVVATPFGWEALSRMGRRLPQGVTGVSSGGPTTDKTWNAVDQIGLGRLVEIYGSSETAGVGWRDQRNQPYRLASDISRHKAQLFRHNKALDLQDRLDWAGTDRFTVLGRKDNVVQVAGTNVNLDELRNDLLAKIGATDLALRLGDNGRLRAFVAMGDQDDAFVRDNMRKALQSLPASSRPSDIRYGQTLPRDAIGKLADWH